MTIEKHCVSLELAKQLKEAGYPQRNSTMVWLNGTDGWEVAVNMFDGGFVSLKANWGYLGEGDTFAAPLASELGEELPHHIDKKGSRYCLKSYKYYSPEEKRYYWDVFYQATIAGDILNMSRPDMHKDMKEADARSKMWLYLKSEGLL